MHTRQQLPDSLVRLGLHQAGVVSTAQARYAGMTRAVIARCLDDGHLTSLTRGIYGLGGPFDDEALAWAGHLIAGEGSRIGGLASAHLNRLVDDAPGVVEVLVPPGRRVSRKDPRWRFVHEQSSVRGRVGRGSPPRLNVEDTVLDLCAGATEKEVVGWVTAAVQRRLTTAARLLLTVEGRPHVGHRRLLVGLLSDVGDGAESPLEVTFLRDVERAHGLPRAQRQLARLGFVSDVAYELFGVLVELDGRRGHEDLGRFRDMGRDNAFLVEGLVTLRYGWVDVVDRPCEVARQIAQVLAGRGWNGLLTRCRRCAALPG